MPGVRRRTGGAEAAHSPGGCGDPAPGRRVRAAGTVPRPCLRPVAVPLPHLRPQNNSAAVQGPQRHRRVQRLRRLRLRHDGAGDAVLLHHPHLGAVKVGITGHPGRLLRFEQRGWNVQHALLLRTGAAAWTLERAVLSKIRAGLGLSFYLTAQQMQGVGGFTETFNAAQLPPAHLRAIADDEELRLNLT